MGEIVNLRRARKDREKRARDETARKNRIAHGRSKAERELTQAQQQLETGRLDAHKRESPDEKA
jgi:hypothetical protein